MPSVLHIVRWVALAALTMGTASADPTAGTPLWSLDPIKDPPLPPVTSMDWPRDPIDHFILARIESAGLTPADDAPPEVLIRRLHYDLIGLPPTKKEVEDFTKAYLIDHRSSLIAAADRLLASPHFGERWGRHWLDVARYAESNGNDGLGRNPTFPHAWRYRDYVIDSLNRDVPYDRFLTEQIAGDLLPASGPEERNRHLIATGFLALGSKPAKAMNNNFDMDVVDNQIDVVSTGVMGLSVACARCHDHKHDPIPTADYYALAGIFQSTETLWGKAANEKLTAPVTPLHQLKVGDGSADVPPADLPNFPKTYPTAIQSLNPALYISLSTPPETLEVQNKVTFSPDTLAEFQGGRLRFEFPATPVKDPEAGPPADADGPPVVPNPKPEIPNPQSANPQWTVAFWFRNDTPNAARPIAAYLFSRGIDGKRPPLGDHLGIGGKHKKEFTGKLIVVNGVEGDTLTGRATVPPDTWNYVVYVRDEKKATVYLNGETRPDIEAEIPVVQPDAKSFFIGARSDNSFAPLAGRIGHFALFDRALTGEEAKALHAASGQPVGTRPPVPQNLAMGVRDRTKAADCKINLNGDSKKLGKVAPRGFLTACGKVGTAPQFTPKASGRLELAEWLTHPDHPLTARVVANRVWLHLFGSGIVATPDDFGIYGARPTHPELLDHLAKRLAADHAWSLKKFIRSLVLSRTYQLHSKAAPALVAADPNNTLNARHSRRRLDAESLRDSILAASGQLDLTPAQGSAIQHLDVQVDKEENLHKPSNHRSIYLCYLRNSPPRELAPFDLPDAVQAAGRRDETTAPAQSLFLLNNPFVIGQGQHLASLLNSRDSTDEEKIATLYHRTFQRDPTKAELSRTLTFLQSGGAWPTLCQAVIVTNEFRYVD